ncbi:MAG: hypothetical protein K6E68_03985 [Lachnospiraceae bacterium]|nr:hypothetical protein [Lachnospiraceae bacterium]
MNYVFKIVYANSWRVDPGSDIRLTFDGETKKITNGMSSKIVNVGGTMYWAKVYLDCVLNDDRTEMTMTQKYNENFMDAGPWKLTATIDGDSRSILYSSGVRGERSITIPVYELGEETTVTGEKVLFEEGANVTASDVVKLMLDEGRIHTITPDEGSETFKFFMTGTISEYTVKIKAAEERSAPVKIALDNNFCVSFNDEVGATPELSCQYSAADSDSMAKIIYYSSASDAGTQWLNSEDDRMYLYRDDGGVVTVRLGEDAPETGIGISVNTGDKTFTVDITGNSGNHGLVINGETVANMIAGYVFTFDPQSYDGTGDEEYVIYITQ